MSGSKSKEKRREREDNFDAHFARAMALSKTLGVSIPSDTPAQFWCMVIIEELAQKVKTLEAINGSDNIQ